MNWNFKTIWAWVCSIVGPALAVLVPYIAQWNWNFPPEAKGGALLAILMGVGLVQMKRPGDHKQ